MLVWSKWNIILVLHSWWEHNPVRKMPLSAVGKLKNPECFKLMDGARPPLQYKNQTNAWFEQKITLWWILNVFWPYHLHTEGYVNAMILLDNYSAYTLSDEEKSRLPKSIFILFLPPNVTNTHQPADMGMIASIKVGYTVTLLEQLWYIFDIEGGYLRASAKRKNQKRGRKGIGFCGTYHLLDATGILKPIWEDDEGKYSRVDRIKRCWWKANILPMSWEYDINNDVGRSSVPIRMETLNKDYCDNISSLLEILSVKAKSQVSMFPERLMV